MLACVKNVHCVRHFPTSLLKMKKKDLSQIYTDLFNLRGTFNLEQVYMIVLATYCINR